MEKNNEKELRVYIQPETEIVKIGGEDFIMQGGIEDASVADPDDL